MTATAVEGKILQVFGPVVDVVFPEGHLPAIYNSIAVKDDAKGIDLILEVAQQMGNSTVRTVAMSTMDGVQRGMSAADTGGPIKVPVGTGTMGRLFDTLGRPLDQGVAHPRTGEPIGPVEASDHHPIHRDAPKFEEQ